MLKKEKTEITLPQIIIYEKLVLCQIFEKFLVRSRSFSKVGKLDFFVAFPSDENNISRRGEFECKLDSVGSLWDDKEFLPLFVKGFLKWSSKLI